MPKPPDIELELLLIEDEQIQTRQAMSEANQAYVDGQARLTELTRQHAILVDARNVMRDRAEADAPKQ